VPEVVVVADSQFLKIEQAPVLLDGPASIRVINQGPDNLVLGESILEPEGTVVLDEGAWAVSVGRSRVVVQHQSLVDQLKERIRVLTDG
jgi:hypothetical protein